MLRVNYKNLFKNYFNLLKKQNLKNFQWWCGGAVVNKNIEYILNTFFVFFRNKLLFFFQLSQKINNLNK